MHVTDKQHNHKLRVFVVASLEVDTSDLRADDESLREATRDAVNKALHNAFGEFDTVKFLGTTLTS